MGVISDQEIVSMVGSEYIDQLAPSLEECSKEKIFTVNQALEYIGTRIIHMKQKYGGGRWCVSHSVVYASTPLMRRCGVGTVM